MTVQYNANSASTKGEANFLRSQLGEFTGGGQLPGEGVGRYEAWTFLLKAINK